ncbi:MAG: pyridoxal-dependent decarboxylase, partial [Gammaproteobacteria bacterium]|nr:pyridoxal-dependent decarboxylase [Gammaproteobacteria bacterium]
MRELLEDVARRANDYLDALPERKVIPDPHAVAELSGLLGGLPDGPSDPMDVLRLLDETVSPATIAHAGPRFFGFVIGGSLPAALAANWLAGAWDQATGLRDVTPGTAVLEEVSLEWLVALLGLPSGCAGGFVTGATMANFSALAAARNAVLTRAGWDVEGDGLQGAPPVSVVVSEEVHPTVLKGLGLLGLGRNRVLRVPVDDQGRMRVAALPALEENTILCVQAGNVNSGAFDPIADLTERAGETGAWVHVDGAFGLWAAASSSYAHLVQGMDAADSWATDAHKWLNVPYDCGIVFVRDAGPLRAAMSVSADYLPASRVRDPSDFTPELSRRARGAEVWAALRSLGRSGVAALVERCCEYARRFAEGLREAGHEVLNDVVLNQVLVSFGDAATTERVIKAVQEDGTCWCGGTVWQGRPAMRISVCNWMTGE